MIEKLIIYHIFYVRFKYVMSPGGLTNKLFYLSQKVLPTEKYLFLRSEKGGERNIASARNSLDVFEKVSAKYLKLQRWKRFCDTFKPNFSFFFLIICYDVTFSFFVICIFFINKDKERKNVSTGSLRKYD